MIQKTTEKGDSALDASQLFESVHYESESGKKTYKSLKKSKIDRK